MLGDVDTRPGGDEQMTLRRRQRRTGRLRRSTRGGRFASAGVALGLVGALALVASACSSGSTPSANSTTKSTSSTSSSSSSTTTAPKQTFTIKMPVISNKVTDVFMPLYAAQNLGIAKANGVTFTYDTVNGGTTLLTAVVAGVAPFSIVPISTAAEAIQQGDNIQTLAVGQPLGAGFLLESKAGSGITKVTQLKGKTICVSHAGSETYLYANWANKKYNLGIKVVPVGASGQLPSLVSGKAAACVEAAPQSYQLLATKKAVELVNFGKTAPIYGVWIAQKGYATSHKAETEALLKTWFETLAKLKATASLAEKQFETVNKETATVAKSEYQNMIANAPTTGGLTVAEINETFTVLKSTPTSKGLPPVTKLATTAFKSVIQSSLNK